MLWQCLHFPRFAIELHNECDVTPAVIIERKGSRRWIIACNDMASEAGLHRNMDVVTAQSRLPSLKLLQRSSQQERNAFKALATWAQQFSSVVCFDAERWLLWIEIGGSLHYFGGLSALNTKIKQGISALNYSATIGIAPTPEAAALLSHYPQAPILKSNNIVAALAQLPLHLLALPDAAHTALHEVGWKYIGEVLQVPRDQLARRFGPSVTKYLQQLLGELPDPREPYRVPAIYRRSFEFVAGVHAVEALLFPLRRMLVELQGYLRSRDTALQYLQLQLIHEHMPPTVIELRTTAPQCDAQRMLLLLRETLERTLLSEDVIELIIVVDQFVSKGDTQQDFFAEARSHDQSWSELLDKLRARLGEQSVKRLGLSDNHLPEKAWCVITTETPRATKPIVNGAVHPEPVEGLLHKRNRVLRQAQHERISGMVKDQANNINKTNAFSMPQRPLWLIEPKLLSDLPTLLGKPERIESGWWTGEDNRRDYYIAETIEGARWWLFRDANSTQWYLHGLWA